INDSNLLSNLKENGDLSEEHISHFLSFNNTTLEDFMILYSINYDFDDMQLINIIKSLSFLDSGKLTEILLFVKLYHPNINIKLLNSDLIKQFDKLNITNICCYVNNQNSTEKELKFKIVVSYGYLDLLFWLYETGEADFNNTKNDVLAIASYNGHLQIVKHLFHKGSISDFQKNLS